MVRLAKRVALVAVGLVLGVGYAHADKSENARKHIAQVLAVASMCPQLEANFVMLSLVSAANGIDLQRDADAIKEEAMRQKEPWRGKEAESCAVGLFLYGPTGTNVKGLLKEK